MGDPCMVLLSRKTFVLRDKPGNSDPVLFPGMLASSYS
jgi:hypothetical protein